jgi:hypothetical protein
VAAAEPRWRVEVALGAAHSFDSTVQIEQEGHPTLDIDASWDGRSFESPLYYGLRLAHADDRGAWALRFVHLKVYLTNPPDEVSRFSVSHGYNLLTLERSFDVEGFEIWIGAGLVIAHPESTIRGLTRPEDKGGPFGGGYFLTGPTGAVAASRRVRLTGWLALLPEVRLTLSRARVPVAEGEASVPNAAVHLLLGVEAGW